MKIGIIHPFFDILGGAENTTLSLIEGLKKTENEVFLYSIKSPKIPETKNFKILKIQRKSFPFFKGFQRLKELDEIFKKIKDEDVILVMSGGLALPKVLNNKIILYCNTIFDEEEKFISQNFDGVKSIYYKKIQNDILKRFKILKQKNVELISNSHFTHNKMKEKFGKNSVVIYPPVKIEEFSKLFDMPKTPRVVTVSRFSHEKNIDFAIEVMNSIDIKYELIGNAGNEKQIKIFNELVKKSKKSIHFHKNITKGEIQKLVSKSKVYFHPSNETFGISVVEAILAGCVPIVPNSSAHKETVPIEELRYSDKNDAIKKIENANLGKFDKLREKLIDNARQYSEEKFQKEIIRQIIK